MNKKILLLAALLLIFSANYCMALEVPLPGFGTTFDLAHYILYFFQWFIGIGSSLAVVALVIAGIQLIFSAGNPGRVGEAKKTIQGAILGLIILLGSYLILITINPQLKTLSNNVAPQEIGGIHIAGSAKEKPAPTVAGDISALRSQGYSSIKWPNQSKDLNGQILNNCDQDNPDAIYRIYFYSNVNLKNFSSSSDLKCGGSVGFRGASYAIVKLNPGVYLFPGAGCNPTDDKIPVPYTSSIPQWDGSWIRSVLIVNGPDQQKGPFFGVIYFNDPDYKTGKLRSAFQHIQFNDQKNNIRCINASGGPAAFGSGTSYIIYQWVGRDTNGAIASAGNGVTLYSRPAWTGGYYEINAQTEGTGRSLWNIDLESKPITYPPTSTIPQEEKQQCDTFKTKYYCLQSFEIKGDYLVLVSSVKDTGSMTNFSNQFAQAFPISPRLQLSYQSNITGYSLERGTPELASDYITSGYAKYMEIIPLSQPITQK
jgi:hypothetical protein